MLRRRDGTLGEYLCFPLLLEGVPGCGDAGTGSSDMASAIGVSGGVSWGMMTAGSSCLGMANAGTFCSVAVLATIVGVFILAGMPLLPAAESVSGGDGEA